jgi:hypothetical protein
MKVVWEFEVTPDSREWGYVPEGVDPRVGAAIIALRVMRRLDSIATAFTVDGEAVDLGEHNPLHRPMPTVKDGNLLCAACGNDGLKACGTFEEFYDVLMLGNDVKIIPNAMTSNTTEGADLHLSCEQCRAEMTMR